MKGIECAFAGRLGKDAELRTSSGGREWMLLSVVVGEEPDEQWVNVSSWSSTTAELAPSLTQGAQIYVEGKLKLRSWRADGGTRWGLSVSASLIQPLAMIGAKKPKRPRAEKAGAKPGEASDSFNKPQDFHSDPLPF